MHRMHMNRYYVPSCKLQCCAEERWQLCKIHIHSSFVNTRQQTNIQSEKVFFRGFYSTFYLFLEKKISHLTSEKCIRWRRKCEFCIIATVRHFRLPTRRSRHSAYQKRFRAPCVSFFMITRVSCFTWETKFKLF